MEAQAAFERLDDCVFLDVRERYEWDAGHIDGSIHIPITQLPARVNEVPTGHTVVCVCQIGQRSDLAARYLRENGYDAHNLEGGMAVWQASGLPFVAVRGDEGQVVDGHARDFNGLLNGDPQPDQSA